MRVTAPLAAALLSAGIAHANDAWPDSPNKRFFESLQRPDNHKFPDRDKNSLSCCGPGDVVKTIADKPPSGGNFTRSSTTGTA